MRKIIFALSICMLVPCVYVVNAIAEDEFVEQEFVEEETRVVGKRVTCDDIKTEINALNAKDELNEEDMARLESLKVEQRSRCMQKAAGRRSIKQKKIVPSGSAPQEFVADEKTTDAAKSTCDAPDENGCCPGEVYKDLGDAGFNCCTANDEHCYPPMKSADVQPGQLCDDGGEPDVNGCCSGETYTDLGNQGFNCCLSDGITCFPPMGK
ncbi:MAG: hypothetical protein IKP24_03455 [Alphaproteobacteria bacterium]|nr:hypothetical protein [Alphaproteobacteria bacterium]